MVFIPHYLKKERGKPFVPTWLGEADRPSSLGTDSFPTLEETGTSPLLLKGGVCVVPYEGLLPMDIRIEEGRILEIGEDLPEAGARIVPVRGKYVIPGILDPHVHLGIYAEFQDELATETRSAVLNGVTTIGLYVNSEESYLPMLEDTIRRIGEISLCDVFIHLAIFNRKQLEEIPLYHSRFGVTSFKTWMCGIPGLIPDAEDDFLMDLMETVASLGKGAVLNIHAENHRVVARATEKLKRKDPSSRSLSTWEESHPGFGEAEAVERAARLSDESGARIYFVHLSSKEAVQSAASLKHRRKNLYFETTSPYLTLCLEQNLNLLYKMSPPIRKREDQDALWEGLREGTLDTIGTDHTPMTREQKGAAPDVWGTPPGYPALGTHLPSLLHEAGKRNFPLERLIEKMTAEPAKVFGLFPRKGTFLPGSDADLVIVDPLLEKAVTHQAAASRADYALHEGKRLTGWPVAIIKSGRILDPVQGSQGVMRKIGRYLERGVDGDMG